MDVTVVAPDETTGSYLLRVEVVRSAIGELSKRRIHPFFLAYLHLRRQASAQGTETEIEPRWKDLEVYLQVAGAPARKPFFRPFWDTPGQLGAAWLNANLAGSFAPSSLRLIPRKVVAWDENSRFTLLPEHAELAFEHLLHGQRAPLGALFGYFFRDFALLTDGPEPTHDEVVYLFRGEFGFWGSKTDDEVETLFDTSFDPSDWFELRSNAAEAE